LDQDFGDKKSIIGSLVVPFSCSKCLFILLALIITSPTYAEEAETDWLPVYGQLPAYRAFSISPDGRHISFIQRGEVNDIFVVSDIVNKKVIYSARVTKFKARKTQFITNGHVLLKGSATTRLTGRHLGVRSRKFENSGALIFNLQTKKMKLAFKSTRNIYPAQTGLGSIIGFNPVEKELYMPAFGKNQAYNLYAVNINSGSARLYAQGSRHTNDWFVNSQGKLLARGNYNERKNVHSLQSYIDKDWKTIYEKKTDVPVINFRGVSVDEKGILFVDDHNNYEAVYSMSLDTGSIKGPLSYKEEAEIDKLKLDINQKLEAVIYSGFLSDYEFQDKALEPMVGALINHFSGNNVTFYSWTQDKNKMIVRVAGPDYPGAYYLFNLKEKSIEKLALQYPLQEIAKIVPIRYKARDGLKIPSILTKPSSITEPKKMPLIVLPHGGPLAYDKIGFDWLAQFLAHKGYLVLQPNFRGSTGFGNQHQLAGYGRWGKEMQDDVSDGVLALIKQGYADPDRVCILGTSYGGYSALSGGAFTPELYRCIISVNGISNIPVMLRDDKAKYGRNHWVISYWEGLVADSDVEKERLKAISPLYFAKKFKAPVLLIHGKDDTIVPMRQSKLMHDKLKSANKQSQLVLLKGEDHWLSTSESRVQMLKTLDEFLNIHNPVK